MDPLNVVITMPFDTPLLEKIQSVSPRITVTLHEGKTPEDIADLIGGTEVLYTWSALPNPADAPHLRWVQLHSAGVDAFLEHPLYTNSDVIFTTTSGIHAVPMAEYVMAMVLAFAHRLPEMMEDKLSAIWPKERWNRYLPKELYGSTIGIIGYGSIGRQVARLAQAFGMKVLAIKRDLRHLEETNTYRIDAEMGDPEGAVPDRIYPPEALHSFLRECDFVVITIPLTPNTWHFVDSDALAAMRPDAVLINVARGEVVDQEALVDVLQQEKIGGAALDVFATEPLPADSKLWVLPNVIQSPHVAGLTPRYYERAADLFAENLRRYIAGEPLINQVERSQGY